MATQRLGVGIIGMGGFAGDHHRAIRTLEQEGECQLVGACDPREDAFLEQHERWELGARGVQVFAGYLEMLDACRDDLAVVTIPTPIPLHASMHRACVDRRLAGYLEKPPTLDPVELEAMIEADSRADRLTQVGFNFIVEPERLALKQRILEGEFGRIRRVSFLGLWPRSSSYFQRNDWSARLMMDGRVVLDSCIGNAMAHYLHNVHFWLGRDGVLSWEEAVSVEAELYRAHAIEGFDTVFAHGAAETGAEILVAATHACIGAHRHREAIECERATIIYRTGDRYTIEGEGGRREENPLGREDLLAENLRQYFRYVRGETDRPITRLVDSRPFVRFNDLAYLAAGWIETVPEPFVRREPDAGGAGELAEIEGIEAACETFILNERFPSRQARPWSRAGGAATVADLPELRSTVERLRDERAKEGWRPA